MVHDQVLTYEGALSSIEDTQVSVAMATYNGALYLPQQLESLAKQTHPPRELIVSDDASTDETLKIVQTFASTAPFPVVISVNAERLGFQDNFLKAAHLCGGRYIAFCDQDDVWHPNKLEVMRDALEKNGALLAVHSAIVTDASLRPLFKLRNGVQDDHCHLPLTLQPFPGKFYGFTLVFDSKVLGFVDSCLRPDVPGQPGIKLYHDVWVALLASSFGKIVFVRQPLAYYRQHGRNTLGAKQTRLITSVLQNFKSPLDHYRWRATFARRYAIALFSSADMLSRFESLSALLAASFYEKIATNYEKRCELFEIAHFSSRLSKLAAMVLRGSYQPVGSGGLGLRSLLKDATLIAFRSQLKKPLEAASSARISAS